MLKKFFSSVKLAISLFLLLLFLSAFGSFVSTTNPQSGILGLVIKITGKSHHEVIDIFTRLGLVDVYHSYLFIFLLILLAINLLVCTVTRLPSVFTILKKEPLINKNIFNDKPYDIEIDHKDEALESKITNMLKSYKIIEECGEDKKVKYITGEKGKLGYLGVHIVHLGVFIILLAGILGGFFGYSGNIAILEGDTDDSVILKDNKTVKLPFKIKLDNFHLSYYDNSSKPKEFKSDIIIHDEGPDKFYTIETNKPLKYKNLWIYQASYGFFPSKDVKFIFNFKAKEMEKKIVVGMDEVYKIDDKISFAVRDFAPSLSLDSQGKLIN
ncbi:MAG: cytochrome c biogenesis protein ResB, partial [Deferribacterales bacterium]